MATSRTALAALAVLLAVAGCADNGATLAAPDQPSQPAPGGIWVVTDVFPGSNAAVDLSQWRGQRLRLDKDGAGDLMGRVCATPVYRHGTTPKATFFGRPDRAKADPGLTETVALLQVTCDGQPFGSYGLWKDGSLLTVVDGSAIRLARQDSLPVAATDLAPPPEPTEAKPAEPHQEAAPVGGTRMVYLASYRGADGAERGWRELHDRSPQLTHLQSATRAVDLGAKGHWVRLFAQAKDDAQAKAICGELRRLLPDCGVKGRD